LAEEMRRCRNVPGEKTKEASSSLRTSVPSVSLVVEKTGKQVRLAGKASVIGRSSSCDIILKVARVSKRHCQILLEKDRVVLEDLDSANGTRVNGEPVQRIQLHDGDEMEICGHLFKIRIQKPATPRKGDSGA